MSTVQHAQSFLRKRKMLLVMPLLVLPFLTLAFWALGGGKATQDIVAQQKGDNELNLELPDAHLKTDKGLDKMSYYEMAEADSEKQQARMRNDPYFKLKMGLAEDTIANDSNSHDSPIEAGGIDKKDLQLSPYHKQATIAGEAKVYDRLQQINAALDNAKAASKVNAPIKTNENRLPRLTSSKEPAVDNQKVDRLESMMHALKEGKAGPDSEMIQINAMLEKVMDIQHPERVSEKLKQYSIAQRAKVFALAPKDGHVNGFYTESNLSDSGQDTDTALQIPEGVEAVVAETQTVVNGATIKLRLLNDVYINGILIPAAAFVFGKATLVAERLTVSIASIRYQNAVLPVALSVYDMDGMEGIYIPGAITRDVAKQSAGNALQTIALNSLDPSIGAQAASAGIETAKTLISKKVKLVRVTVKAGYRVLLNDNNNK